MTRVAETPGTLQDQNVDSQNCSDSVSKGMSDFSAPGASDPLIGSSVVGYLVKGRLGSGGMGVVYEGEQTTIGKRVAIKVLRSEVSEDPTTVQRLVSEARAVNAVGHRGIIDVFAYGQMPDGRHAIVMELLDGEPLDEVLEAHRASGQLMALPDSLLILQETLAALHAAHSAGVIHRDLKPSNVFLCRQRDGSRFVKILDFGIAKLGVSQNVSAQASMLVGTPSYMAPEQASGGKVGPALDMYAVGVMSFEMLTGLDAVPRHGRPAPRRGAGVGRGLRPGAAVPLPETVADARARRVAVRASEGDQSVSYRVVCGTLADAIGRTRRR